MPALRGKDYGKNRRVYSDFVQTESGLQYKVEAWASFGILIYKVYVKGLEEQKLPGQFLGVCSKSKQDLKEGSGDFANNGDRVVIDWDG